MWIKCISCIVICLMLLCVLVSCNNSEVPTTEATESPTENPTEQPTTVIPTFIEEARMPTYLPEGIEAELVMQSMSATIVDYYDKNDNVYASFWQKTLTSDNMHLSNEGATVTHLEIQGHEAMLITYETQMDLTLIWTDGEYVYCMLGVIATPEELIKMAESIQ